MRHVAGEKNVVLKHVRVLVEMEAVREVELVVVAMVRHGVGLVVLVEVVSVQQVVVEVVNHKK